MDNEHFAAGIKHLEIVFNAAMSGERKRLYFLHLQEIPNDLWNEGIISVATTASFFPSIAQIGEACVPGEAEREEIDRWTRFRVTIKTPWTQRLKSLISPPQHEVLLSPEPRTPLSESEQGVYGMFQAAYKNIFAELKEKFFPPEEEVSLSYEERLRLKVKREGPRPLQKRWTTDEMEERRQEIHEQVKFLASRSDDVRQEEKDQT